MGLKSSDNCSLITIQGDKENSRQPLPCHTGMPLVSRMRLGTCLAESATRMASWMRFTRLWLKVWLEAIFRNRITLSSPSLLYWGTQRLSDTSSKASTAKGGAVRVGLCRAFVYWGCIGQENHLPKLSCCTSLCLSYPALSFPSPPALLKFSLPWKSRFKDHWETPQKFIITSGTGKVLHPVIFSGFPHCSTDRRLQVLVAQEEGGNRSLSLRSASLQGQFPHCHTSLYKAQAQEGFWVPTLLTIRESTIKTVKSLPSGRKKSLTGHRKKPYSKKGCF